MNGIPKNWLVLTQYYPPEIGAPQIRLRPMVRSLRQHGFDVSVLALPNYPAGKILPGYEKRWSVREEIDGVPVRRTWVYAATGKSTKMRLANYLSFTVTAMMACLFGPRPDVMFVESQPLSLGVVAILMKWLRSVPYVYNIPDLQIQAAQQLGFIKNARFLTIAQWLEDFFMKQSWKVSTVTQAFVEHYEQRGIPRDQLTFLPNGADSEFLRPLPPSSRLLDRWKLHGKKVLLYVGTHALYHGLDTLIEAAALLQQQKDLVFLTVGNGPEKPRLQRLSEERGLINVIFAESPYEEMDELYSIAYLSIAMLRKMAVAQYMRLSKIFPSLSCGVPVIYSGIGEGAELLQRWHCGLVVEPEEPSVLADTISRLVADVALRDQMGVAGRVLVEREYSWSAIVRHWLNEIGLAEKNRVRYNEAKGPCKADRGKVRC